MTPKEKNYAVYLEERKALVESENESADQFDKNVLALAGGAFGVSIVFLEKIAPNPDRSTLPFLYLSWSALLICLLTTLSSFLTSQSGYRAQRRILEKELLEGQNIGANLNSWAKATKVLNWVSIFAFLVGVLMLAVFSIQNIRLKLPQPTLTQNTKETVMNMNKPDNWGQRARIPQESPRRPEGIITTNQNPKPQTGRVPAEAPKPVNKPKDK